MDNLPLPDSTPLLVVVAVAAAVVAGLHALASEKPGDVAHAWWALCAATPLGAALLIGVEQEDVGGLLWMLSPHDQATLLSTTALQGHGLLALGAVLSAAVSLIVAGASARRLFAAGVDRRLGFGSAGAVALVAPVVVFGSRELLAPDALAGVPPIALTILGTTAVLAAVVVVAATYGGLARLAGAGGARRMLGATALAASAVLYAGLGVDALVRAAVGVTSYPLLVLAAAVLVAAGGVAAWARAALHGASRIRGARHMPTPGLSQGLADPDARVGRASLVVAVIVVAACAGLAWRVDHLQPTLLAEPLWPASVEPLNVDAGTGRGADVVVFADGTWSALSGAADDSDVPAVLVDRRAGPHATEPLFAALAQAGHAHALLVGPRTTPERGHTAFGGMLFSTAECACEQAGVPASSTTP